MSTLKLGWLAMVAVGLVVGTAGAQKPNKGQGKGNKDKSANAAVDRVFTLPAVVELTAEQQKQLGALRQEWETKINAAARAADLNSILTNEQRAERRRVQHEAKTSGKKGKEIRAAIEDAVKLTDAQKKQREEASQKLHQLESEVRDKVMALLTTEQKSKMPITKKGGKKKKNLV